MEMQNQSNLSLLALLPDGKVENDIRIADKTVTGICTVYVKRTDDEKEFLLREIGVAALNDNNLTEAVRVAVREAYEAAINHIAGITPSAEHQQPQVSENTQRRGAKPTPGPKPEPEAITPAPDSGVENESEPPNDEADATNNDEQNSAFMGTEVQRPPVDLGSIVDIPEKSEVGSVDGASPVNDKAVTPVENGGVERIEFSSNLFPASDLIKTAETGNSGDGVDDGGDPEYQKALDMEITIFGKLHDCNGWKAGRILNERPDVIVDFCNRNSASFDGPKYTGPRVEQKESLFKLYPDAVRNAQKAA